MNKTHLSLIAVAATLLLAACDMLDYHPYDVDTRKLDINSRNAALIERNCALADTVRFIAAGDTQGSYDCTRQFVNSVNSLCDSTHVDFVLHTGDFTDYGTMDEYGLQHEILDKLKVPYVGCLGNHDCLGTGKQAFAHVFGPTDFAFIAGRVKFVLLNTNALEFDYSVPIPNFDFLENEQHARRGEFDRTVVAMHAAPHSDVFPNVSAKPFEHYLRMLPGLLMCINGHDHQLVQRDIFGDGVIYYGTPNIAKRRYYLFTITTSGYHYEIKAF